MFTEFAHNIVSSRRNANNGVNPDEAFEAAAVKLLFSRIIRDPESHMLILPVAPSDRNLIASLVALGLDREDSPYYMTQCFPEAPGYRTLHFYSAGVEMLKAKGATIDGVAVPVRSV